MNKKILVSGATGFLGSNIVNLLCKFNYTLICLKRANSDCFRVNSDNNIIWINIEDKDWEKKIHDVDYIIHSGWNGVNSTTRDDFSIQMKNMEFLNTILKIAKLKNVKQIIGFGSQAEYGYYDGIISENQNENPKSYYGTIKLATSKIIEGFCNKNKIKWIWLRLFPLFGELESSNWFIPSLVKKIINKEQFDMTKGEQVYSYLYINDFSKWIKIVLESSLKSGVYNVSSKQNLISLKQLIVKITDILDYNLDLINIGALEYRKNQPMLMAGKISKLEDELGILCETNFDQNLKNVVNALKTNLWK